MFAYDAGALPERFEKAIGELDTSYRYADAADLAEYVLEVLKRMEMPALRRTVEENRLAFERGWAENLAFLQAGVDPAASLRPKYFRDTKFLRYDNRLIVSSNLDLEYDLFTLARCLIFTKLLPGFEDIYEIGCGSCQNLLLLSEMFPSATLHGLDWTQTSSQIAETLSRSLGRPIVGRVFDMMNPSPDVDIKPGSAVITIHAMEQVGTRHGRMLAYLLESRPGLVIHYEPILEYYDGDNLLDYLALTYSRKRKYLSGFLTALQRLERQGRIEILDARRPYLGGVIHEASLVVWRPA